MADKARLLAARALLRVSSGGFSNIVLDSMLEEAKLDKRDRAFASALFYGVLERRITIDILIKKVYLIDAMDYYNKKTVK